MTKKEHQELEHLIWKAKHQRKLTDAQINYFLDRCPRWDFLTYYSGICRRRMHEAIALAWVRHDLHVESECPLVIYPVNGQNPARTCAVAISDIKEPQMCHCCGQRIGAPGMCVELRDEDGLRYILHEKCAVGATQTVTKTEVL